jgi:hypothetical protein
MMQADKGRTRRANRIGKQASTNRTGNMKMIKSTDGSGRRCMGFVSERKTTDMDNTIGDLP